MGHSSDSVRHGALESSEALLQTMVRFDTVNSSISGKPDAELELSVFLEGIASNAGFGTRRLPVSGEGFNLLVTHEVSPDAPWLFFESHLDTVTVSDMTIPPFDAQIRDGRVHGRGSCDTKGTGAAMFRALQQYHAGPEGPNNVAIVYTLDEEISKTGVRTFVGRHLDEIDQKPVGVIVGEPTGLELVVAHNGVMRWSIETRGVAAHSSDPTRGRSAISMMVRVVQAIESRYIPTVSATHELTGRARCSINVIEGGVQANVIPERCKIRLDRRLVPGEDWRDVQPAVEEILDDLRREDADFRAVQDEKPYVSFPLRREADGPLARFAQGVLAEIGLPAAGTGVQYATDASDLSEAGVPAVVIGPGNIEQAHTCDEWLDIGELHRGVEVYLALMRSPSLSKVTAT